MLSSGYGSVMADFERMADIERAIAQELGSGRTYAALAALAPDENARKLLQDFSCQEEEHAKSLAQAYAALAQMNWRGEPSDAAPGDYREALRECLLAETEDYARYAKLSRQAASPRLRELFLRLRDEEAVHAMRLPLLF